MLAVVSQRLIRGWQWSVRDWTEVDNWLTDTGQRLTVVSLSYYTDRYLHKTGQRLTAVSFRDWSYVDRCVSQRLIIGLQVCLSETDQKDSQILSRDWDWSLIDWPEVNSCLSVTKQRLIIVSERLGRGWQLSPEIGQKLTALSWRMIRGYQLSTRG